MVKLIDMSVKECIEHLRVVKRNIETKLSDAISSRNRAMYMNAPHIWYTSDRDAREISYDLDRINRFIQIITNADPNEKIGDLIKRGVVSMGFVFEIDRIISKYM